MGKRITVNDDTLVNMSTTYTRGDKNKPKRAFNFVIKSVLISTALVSSVLNTGAFTAATTASAETTDGVVATSSTVNYYQDQQALVSNLKMANKVLDAAISTGQLNKSAYEGVMKKLVALDVKLDETPQFDDHIALIAQLEVSKTLLLQETDATDTDILDAQDTAYQTLQSVMQKAGMQEDSEQVAISMVSASKVTNYKTTISGKSVSLKNKSVKKGTKYFISPTDVLKKLGATVSYNTKTKTLTIKDGKKKTTIKAGSQYAHVNGVKYKLSSTMQTINKKTYAPYDIISKATNYKASVSKDTIKIVKKTTTTSAGKTNNSTPASTVKGLYQGHTYTIKTQAQYDKVIDWVKKHMNGSAVTTLKFGAEYAHTGAYSDYYNKGKTFNFYTSNKKPKDITDYELGLSAAEASLSSLKKNGVSYSTASEVWKLAYSTILAMQSIQAKDDHTTDSLYDYIFNHKGDCDGDAQMYQVIFDMYGYQTRIHRTSTHATPQVKIGNHWYNVIGDSFSQAPN